MKKLWLMLIWWVEAKMDLWGYQFSNIDNRKLPTFEEIEREYASLIKSLNLIGDKISKDGKWSEMVRLRTSCIIMWVLRYFNNEADPTTDTETLRSYVEKTLQMPIKEEQNFNLYNYERLNPMHYGVSLWNLSCGGEDNKKRISLTNILINQVVRTGD